MMVEICLMCYMMLYVIIKCFIFVSIIKEEGLYLFELIGMNLLVVFNMYFD